MCFAVLPAESVPAVRLFECGVPNLPEGFVKGGASSVKNKILTVDDEADIRMLIRIILEKRGYTILEAVSGDEAVAAMVKNPDIDLVIMDIMMPRMSGTDACAKIREFSQAPVLFLTAKTRDFDKDEAYGCGGDDFLSKPFTPSELMRKVCSLIRRYRVYNSAKGEKSYFESASSEGIVLNPVQKTVMRNGELIRLSGKEYEILAFLMTHRGITWSLQELYENVWHDKYLPSSSNTVMVHVLRLRQKVEICPERPSLIRTVYGKGYRID